MHYVHSVFWGNPYTEPPNGMPRYLLEVENSDRRPKDMLRRKMDAIIDRRWKRSEYSWSLVVCQPKDAR